MRILQPNSRSALIFVIIVVGVAITTFFYFKPDTLKVLPKWQRVVIQDVNPPHSSTIYAGEEVLLEMTIAPDIAVDKINVLCPVCDVRETDGGTPQRVVMKTPREFIGPIKILLIPIANGSPLLGTEVVYNVELPPNLTLIGLEVAPTAGVDVQVGLDSRVWIYAKYSDGRFIDISASTDFNVEPAGLVEFLVAKNNIGEQELRAKGIDYGVAVANFNYRGQSTKISLRVGISDVDGDFNNDRIIDQQDKQIIRNALGRKANPQDPRDLNRDGIIDNRDLDALGSF